MIAALQVRGYVDLSDGLYAFIDDRICEAFVNCRQAISPDSVYDAHRTIPSEAHYDALKARSALAAYCAKRHVGLHPILNEFLVELSKYGVPLSKLDSAALHQHGYKWYLKAKGTNFKSFEYANDFLCSEVLDELLTQIELDLRKRILGLIAGLNKSLWPTDRGKED